MIDPLLSLAFSVQSQKGVYALLLGSGVSRSSGIPTGWEVVLDLIRKLARLHGEDCEPNPEEWFRKKHGAEPDYSKLLDALAQTPAGRQQLLRSYFEPTEDERSQNLKRPTAAHKAIASLVLAGYVRVILTTNFDRLLEMALEEAGVHATVISTPDAVVGALPLVHAGCTVIKLHGDYLDTRIRNTISELEAYESSVDGLLDRILDEYGLVVCGWSGDWDTALRSAILRAPSRRFGTFWADRGRRSEQATQLISQRQAQLVSIKDADSFFVELAEKVKALEDSSAPHPLSTKALVSAAKRYLPDDANKIRLFDLVSGETERLHATLCESVFSPNTNTDPKLDVPARVKKYENLSAPLATLVAVGCYWGRASHRPLWIRTLDRIGSSRPRDKSGYVHLLELQTYPALILLYAGGIAAIAASQYETLCGLFVTAKTRDESKSADQPFAATVNTWQVMNREIGWLLPGMEKRVTPLSDHLLGVLREPLREFLPDDEVFQDSFDRFELFLAIQHAVLTDWPGSPIGRFGWRNRRFSPDRQIAKRVLLEASEAGEIWLPLRAGLFGGTLATFKSAHAKVADRIEKIDWD